MGDKKYLLNAKYKQEGKRGHREEIKHQTHWGHRLEMVIILNLHHLIKKSPPSPDTQIYLIPSGRLTVRARARGTFLSRKITTPMLQQANRALTMASGP